MRRLAALVLPLLLLLPVGASAQSPQPPVVIPPPECILMGSELLTDQDCGGASVSPAGRLADAQSYWDAVAKLVGAKVITRWLGPRPVTVDDLWWVGTLVSPQTLLAFHHV